MGAKPPKISKREVEKVLNSRSKQLSCGNPAKGSSESGKESEKAKVWFMESSSGSGSTDRKGQALSSVVSECVKKWFKDTLKEAKAGDINMQVLLSQMYFTGYGVPPDHNKGMLWMTRASKTRPSVWKVSKKRPGYNASDSDSEA